MRFVLASSSPRRQDLIASLGIEFVTVKPEIDESIHEGEAPLEYVRRLSMDKAGAVIARLHEHQVSALVLAADTIVLSADTIGIDEETFTILGKPADAAEARAMLMRLREVPHMVYTAFRLAKLTITQDTENNLMEFVDDLVGTKVQMRDYTDAEIEQYIATGDPFDKAGGYAIQHPDFRPVAEIDGCYNNVVGLPLCAVKRALAKFGRYGFGVSDDCDCPPYFPPLLD
jgi:MAF protein